MTLDISDPEDLIDALERAANIVRWDDRKLAARLDAYAQQVVDTVDAGPVERLRVDAKE